MKKLVLLFTFILMSFSSHAVELKRFAGAWDFYRADVVNVIETNGLGTWTSRSCVARDYMASKACTQPYPDSKVELMVYDQKLGGLCSVTEKEYCWFLVRVIPGATPEKDTLVIKADPFNRKPGLGYAISAPRLLK